MVFLPKDAADSCIRRARRFLDLAGKPLSDSKARNDLRRMALVMSVAAIDSYMHALVLRRLADVRRAADLPKALSKLDLPFSQLADLADAANAAQRQKKRSRPWVQVKAALQERLLTETFQSFEQVATALSMTGIKEAWRKIADELGETSQENKDWLNRLVHRRNQVVHEGDLKRAARPRKLKFNDIDPSSVKQDVDWMEALIDAIDKVVAAE